MEPASRQREPKYPPDKLEIRCSIIRCNLWIRLNLPDPHELPKMKPQFSVADRFEPGAGVVRSDAASSTASRRSVWGGRRCPSCLLVLLVPAVTWLAAPARAQQAVPLFPVHVAPPHEIIEPHAMPQAGLWSGGGSHPEHKDGRHSDSGGRFGQPGDGIGSTETFPRPPLTSVMQRFRPGPADLPAAQRRSVWKTPYSYGYFGAKSKRHWTSHHGYRDRYTQWSLR